MRIASAIFIAGMLLAACGQRGPLYLPGEEREEVDPVDAPAATSPALPASPVATPLASPIPRAAPPAPAPGAASDEAETTRRNRIN